MRFFVLGFVCAVLASSAFADPRDFTVNPKPVFQSNWNWVGAPVAIEIENKGPDAQGQILAANGSTTTRYPIELPTGSKKRIVTYMGGSEYGSASEFTFDSNQGRFMIPYLPKGNYSYGSTAIVAFISDTSGDLGFLRQAEQAEGRQQNVLGDAYCIPEDAPERPVGYLGIAAVVLGPGADRLSDASVKALQTYALTGGTLIFIGGASATTLSDPRWASALPGSSFQTKTVVHDAFLNDLAGTRTKESVTVASGTPIPSAQVQRAGPVAMVMERGFGIGRVVLFAFNPFEEPMVRWPGRKRLFTSTVRGVDYLRNGQFLNQFEHVGAVYERGYSSGYATTYPGGGPAPMSSGRTRMYQEPQDPFSIELPGPSKVFWTLAAFFLVVVPINFGVLRAFKKGEWAWVTSPVICLAFSGIFLSQASELYSANLSTATTGILIAQEGVSEGIFVGSTKMFFPNGGSYDLKMENVDQLALEAPEYYSPMSGEQDRSQIDPVDVGVIRVPDLRAANLAFEEIGYRQRFAKVPRVSVKATTSGPGQISLTIKNNSTVTLTNSAVLFAGQRHGLSQLAPGAQHTMRLSAGSTPPGQNAGFLEALTARQRVAIIETDLPDLRPGPQIGAAVSGRSNIRLIYVAPTPLGGRRS